MFGLGGMDPKMLQMMGMPQMDQKYLQGLQGIEQSILQQSMGYLGNNLFQNCNKKWNN